jgi:hypothetical protein
MAGRDVQPLAPDGHWHRARLIWLDEPFWRGGNRGAASFTPLAESSSLCSFGIDIVPIHKRHRKNCAISLKIDLICMTSGAEKTRPSVSWCAASK